MNKPICSPFSRWLVDCCESFGELVPREHEDISCELLSEGTFDQKLKRIRAIFAVQSLYNTLSGQLLEWPIYKQSMF